MGPVLSQSQPATVELWHRIDDLDDTIRRQVRILLLNSLQLSELECPTEGGSFDPPGSDQRGLPQLGFVKLLPQLPTRPRLGTDSPAPLPEFRSAVPRPLPLALAAQKYSLRLEGSMTFMWQAPVAPNKLTCVLGILLNSLQLSELECPTALDATG